MTTISFSVEDGIKRDFDEWAKQTQKSKSDLFREMVKAYRFNQELDTFSVGFEAKLKDLGIDTEEELYEYLQSDETYESRIRQQRLSGRSKAE